jgi:Trk K+ transport system NAD-binding subunit
MFAKRRDLITVNYARRDFPNWQVEIRQQDDLIIIPLGDEQSAQLLCARLKEYFKVPNKIIKANNKTK